MQQQIDKTVKYHDNGKPKLIEYKINGFKQNPVEGKPAVVEYYESGIPKNEQNWERGRKHGISKYYYSDGKLDTETHWYHGALHNVNGPAISSYYPNGKLRTESWWRNDFYYSDNGKPVYAEYNMNGIVINKFDFFYNKFFSKMTALTNPITFNECTKTTVCNTQYMGLLCNEHHPMLEVYNSLFSQFRVEYVSNMDGRTEDLVLIKSIRDIHTGSYKFHVTIVSEPDKFKNSIANSHLQHVVDNVLNWEIMSSYGYDYESRELMMLPMKEWLRQFTEQVQARVNFEYTTIKVEFYQKTRS